MNEALSLCENLLYFLCSTTPQPAPPNTKLNHFKLFESNSPTIKVATIKCKSVGQLLQYLKFKGTYNKELMRDILDTENNNLVNLTYYEKLAIQLTISFLQLLAIGKKPENIDLLIRVLLKLMTQRNQQIFLIAMSVVIPVYCKELHFFDFISFADEFYQKCYIQENNYPQIYNTIHLILKRMVCHEINNITDDSHTIKLLDVIQKIMEKMPPGFPKKEIFEIFQAIQPLLLKMNKKALAFLPHIFGLLKHELVAVFIQKFAESLVENLLKETPPFVIITNKNLLLEFDTSSKKECFTSPSRYVEYSKPSEKFFEDISFSELIDLISNITLKSEDISTVFMNELCWIIDSHTESPNCINLIVAYVILMTKSHFPVERIPSYLFDPRITTKEGRRPIFNLIYFALMKGITSHEDILISASKYPEMLSEILHALSLADFQISDNAKLVDAFSFAGNRCIDGMSCVLFDKTWFEVSLHIKKIISDTKQKEVFKNNNFLSLLFSSLYDRGLREAVLQSAKSNLNSNIITGLATFMASLDFDSSDSHEILSSVATILFDSRDPNAVPQDICMHAILKIADILLCKKEMEEKSIMNFQEALLKYKNKDIFYKDVCSLLARDDGSIKFPHTLYLIYNVYVTLPFLLELMNDRENCRIAQKCGFDAFLSYRLAENLTILPLFEKIVKVACSEEAVREFFTLLTIVKDPEFHERAFSVLSNLLSEQDPPYANQLTDGIDLVLPEGFNHLSHYFIATFATIEKKEYSRLFSLNDADGDILNVSISPYHVVVNSSIASSDYIKEKKWIPIVVEANKEMFTVYAQSNKIGSFEARKAAITSRKTLVIGNCPYSRTRIYGTGIFKNLKLPVKGFEFEGEKLIEFSIKEKDPFRSFYQQFISIFHAEAIFPFFAPKDQFFAGNGIEVFKAVSTLISALLASNSEQKHFIDIHGPEVLAYLLQVQKSADKNFETFQALCKLFDNTSNTQFLQEIVHNVIGSPAVIMPLSSDHHIAVLSYLAKIILPSHMEAFTNEMKVEYALSVLSLHYSYKLGFSSLRDPFLDVEKCRSIILKAIITASKFTFSEEQISSFIDFILYTNEITIRLELLRTLSQTLKTIKISVDNNACEVFLAKLYTLFDENDVETTCLVTDIAILLIRNNKLPLIEQMAVLQNQITKVPPTDELIDGLNTLIRDGMYELFEFCSMLAVKRKDTDFFKLDIPIIERTSGWCTWVCLGMIRDSAPVYASFLSRVKPTHWSDIISCLSLLCGSYKVDERSPILEILNLIFDRAVEGKTFKRDAVSKLISITERFLFFGRKSITKSALQKAFLSSPFGGSSSPNRKEFLGSTLFCESQDLQMILQSFKIEKDLQFNIRIDNKGKCKDADLAKKLLQTLQTYKCPEHLKLGFLTNFFLSHQDPQFSSSWSKSAMETYKQNMKDHNIQFIIYRTNLLQGINIPKTYDSSFYLTCPLDVKIDTAAITEFQGRIKEESERVFKANMKKTHVNSEKIIQNVQNKINKVDDETKESIIRNKAAWENFKHDPKHASWLISNN